MNLWVKVESILHSQMERKLKLSHLEMICSILSHIVHKNSALKTLKLNPDTFQILY